MMDQIGQAQQIEQVEQTRQGSRTGRIGQGAVLNLTSLAVAAALVTAFLVNYLLSTLVYASAGLSFDSTLVSTLFLVLVTGMEHAVLVLALRAAPDCRAPAREPANWSAPRLAGAVLCCLGVAYPAALVTRYLLQGVSALLGVAYVYPTLQAGLLYHPFVYFLFSVLLIPFLEVHIFCEMLYHKLIGYGQRTFVLFSATLFSLFHASLHQFFYTFVFGIAMAVIFLQTGTMRNAFLIHSLNNMLSFVTLMLVEFDSPALVFWQRAELVLALVGVGLCVWVLARRRGQIVELFRGGERLGKKLRLYRIPGFLMLVAVAAAYIAFYFFQKHYIL